MLKDINFPEIKGVTLAVAYALVEGEDQWVVHLINENKVDIQNVLVVSKGYGKVKKEQVKTSTLRRFFESIPAGTTQQIEPVPKELIGLANEYWVSFYIKEKVFDKKFVFTAGALTTEYLVNLPVLNQKGILHA